MAGQRNVSDWLGHPRSVPVNEPPFVPTNRDRWMQRAACVGTDPEVWFPSQGPTSERTDLAVRICHTCEVRVVCLAYALTYNLEGIWGGTTSRRRTTLRQKRANA